MALSWPVVLAVSLACPLSAPGQPQLTAQVVRVVDGDTIHVRINDRIEKVRYIGVNAPELHHPTKGASSRSHARLPRRTGSSWRAKRFAWSWTYRSATSTGGSLPTLYIGDMMVNAEIVAQGYAQVMTIPPNVK